MSIATITVTDQRYFTASLRRVPPAAFEDDEPSDTVIRIQTQPDLKVSLSVIGVSGPNSGINSPDDISDFINTFNGVFNG